MSKENVQTILMHKAGELLIHIFKYITHTKYIFVMLKTLYNQQAFLQSDGWEVMGLISVL